MLTRVEEQLGKETIANHVELVAGTSTGGILALGIGAGMPARDLLEFYRVHGREIFPRPSSSRIVRVLKSIFRDSRKSKYDHRILRNALQESFQGKLLGESRCRLVIPSFQLPKSEVAVFKTDHHPDYRRDWQTPMWKVARATSAAPAYIDDLREPGAAFLDGGVWANNPVMLAVIEALSAYTLLPHQIQVVSIGTGNYPFEIDLRKLNGGWANWLRAIECAMHLNTDNASSQARLLLGPEQYIRLEPPEHGERIDLDDYAGAWAKLPEMAEEAFADNSKRLATFFSEPATPRERHYCQNTKITVVGAK